tara:strand:+ start:403 stop:531 length:129 start_codon:yes stop_codon:yes gene_type:complete
MAKDEALVKADCLLQIKDATNHSQQGKIRTVAGVTVLALVGV